MSRSFTVEPVGEREIVMSRGFPASRVTLFDAHVRPELLRRWLSTPGWTFRTCEIDASVGGSYRYVWKRDGSDERLGLSGEFIEVAWNERIVASERFDVAWYPGEARVTTTFNETDGVTTVTMTIRYESREARDGVLAGPAAKGVEAGYAKLARLVEDLQGDFR